MSCKEDEKEQESVVVSAEKYNNPKDEIIEFDTIKHVKIVYKDSIADWKGYHRVQQTLERISTTSPNEVLSSADELVKNIIVMKDSILIKALIKKGIKARINGLYNQSLRLQDMKHIPAITVKEITNQTQGLFVIFRMINRKINAIYDQVDFENDMKNDTFFFSKIDSIQ